MKYQVKDAGDTRKYFIQVPNMIDDLDLSPYAFRLYVHLKRVAGDEGTCWQSTNTLAKACQMSSGSVSNAKKELHKLGLIAVMTKKNTQGGIDHHEITIIDIWPRNITRYVTSSPHEQASSPHEQASSPGETKNNPLRITQESASPKNGDARAASSVEDDHRKQTEQSLLKGIAKAKENGDLSDYPEDVRPTIQAVAEHFKLRPPTTKKGKGYWIMQARELIDACGEWGTRAIQEYRQDFETYMDGHQGVAPHTVEGPGSLVKVIRAKSGTMRGELTKDTSQMSDREYRAYLNRLKEMEESNG